MILIIRAELLSIAINGLVRRKNKWLIKRELEAQNIGGCILRVITNFHYLRKYTLIPHPLTDPCFTLDNAAENEIPLKFPILHV